MILQKLSYFLNHLRDWGDSSVGNRWGPELDLHDGALGAGEEETGGPWGSLIIQPSKLGELWEKKKKTRWMPP